MYFLVLPQQSSLLGLYRPVLLHLLGNKGKCSPSFQTNTENQLFQYCPPGMDNIGGIIKNICIMTQVRKYGEIQPELSGNHLAPPSGFPLCSGYISPYIPPLVIIQIKTLKKKTRYYRGQIETGMDKQAETQRWRKIRLVQVLGSLSGFSCF